MHLLCTYYAHTMYRYCCAYRRQSTQVGGSGLGLGSGLGSGSGLAPVLLRVKQAVDASGRVRPLLALRLQLELLERICVHGSGAPVLLCGLGGALAEDGLEH
eukprot:scaffold98244_cov54-Phaeocystis_antarctica.AAC.1